MALSLRAEHHAQPGPLDRLWKVLANLYDPTTNPDGYISLGVAENTLMHSVLNDHIHKNLSLPTQDLTYGDGQKQLRATLAKFFNKYFKPAAPIEPNHIAVTNGCTSAIEHMAWALGNPGDGFLLGRPFYGAFVDDVTGRFGTKLLTVDFNDIDPMGVEGVKCYERELLAAQERGQRVAGLILCQPHNPLGRCYSRETITELMRLCEKYKIHLISDEIYALSVFTNNVDKDVPFFPFTSVASIDTTGVIDPALIHILWGMSKDFGANGIRMGTIISQNNPLLHAAIVPVSLMSSTSALTDHAVDNVLSDEEWVEDYIAENRALLAQQYEYVAKWARRNKIEYAPGVNAGFFLWVNLGKMYKETHGEVEDTSEVVMNALLEHGIFLASGAQFGAEEPGWFRIVFSHPTEYLDVGLKRIEKTVLEGSEKDRASDKDV